MFLTIFGCAAALIVLGCFNLSALMASRADERWREFATRRALGAGAARLVRLAIAESVLVVSAGIVMGLVLASPILSVTTRLLPQSLGLLKPPAIDARVLLFAIAASVVVVAIVSIWPVRRSLKAHAVAFNGLGQTFSAGSAGRMVAIAAQIALGFVLALGGTLLTGSLLRVWQIDPGFAADRLVVMAAGIQQHALGDRAAAAAAVQRELAQLPGVESVGATQSPILRGGVHMNAFTKGATYAITPGFFSTAGLTLTVATAADLLDDTVRGRRLNAWVFGGFAAAALAILSVGILGLLAMTTARRARELGIRLALGATRRRIVALLAKEQLVAVAAGIALGGVMSFWAVEFVRSLVYQLRVYDPRLWAAAGAIILFTAAVGSLIPCWRATKVDPIQTLKADRTSSTFAEHSLRSWLRWTAFAACQP